MVFACPQVRASFARKKVDRGGKANFGDGLVVG